MFHDKPINGAVWGEGCLDGVPRDAKLDTGHANPRLGMEGSEGYRVTPKLETDTRGLFKAVLVLECDPQFRWRDHLDALEDILEGNVQNLAKLAVDFSEGK